MYNKIFIAISSAESDRLKNSKNILVIVDVLLVEWKYYFNLSLSLFFRQTSVFWS